MNLDLNSRKRFFKTGMNFETAKFSLQGFWNHKDCNTQDRRQARTGYLISNSNLNSHPYKTTMNFKITKNHRLLKSFKITLTSESSNIFEFARSPQDELPPAESTPGKPTSAQPVSLTDSTPVIPERQDQLQRVS